MLGGVEEIIYLEHLSNIHSFFFKARTQDIQVTAKESLLVLRTYLNENNVNLLKESA
jgi:hypothetical protein